MTKNNTKRKIRDLQNRFSEALDEAAKAYPEPNYLKKFFWLWRLNKCSKLNLIFEFLLAPKWLKERYCNEVEFQFNLNNVWRDV